MEPLSLALAIPPVLVGIARTIMLLRSKLGRSTSVFAVLIGPILTQCELLEGVLRRMHQHDPSIQSLDAVRAIIFEFGDIMSHLEKIIDRHQSWTNRLLGKADIDVVERRLRYCQTSISMLPLLRDEFQRIGFSEEAVGVDLPQPYHGYNGIHTHSTSISEGLVIAPCISPAPSESNTISFSDITNDSNFSTRALFINQPSQTPSENNEELDALVTAASPYHRAAKRKQKERKGMHPFNPSNRLVALSDGSYYMANDNASMRIFAGGPVKIRQG